MVDIVSKDDLHTCDVISCAYHNGYIFTGDDNGIIKVWTEDLNPVFSWKAHDHVVYDLVANHNNGDIYSCSLDGQISRWRIERTVNRAQILNTAIQTGPSGSGQGLPGVGDNEGSSLEHQPADVRKLFWRGDHLYSGDHMGSICRWTPDLQLEMKQEYFTEIWCLFVDEDESVVYSGRDNDIIMASLPKKSNLDARCAQVKGNIPGRCPVVASKDNSIVAVSNRNGLHVDIWSNKDDLDKREKVQILDDHDMIVNCLCLCDEDQLLLSAGWDAKLNFWRIGGDGMFSLSKSVKVDSYVNCLCVSSTSVYVCGKSGYIAKINKE